MSAAESPVYNSDYNLEIEYLTDAQDIGELTICSDTSWISDVDFFFQMRRKNFVNSVPI